MSRVLVTGGAGFIGSQVVRILLERGHEIALLVRPTTSLARLGVSANNVRIILGDVAEAADLITRLPWMPDQCAHLAWYSEPRTYLTSDENLKSLAASRELLPALIRAGCSSFVVPGTCAEYRTTHRRLTEDSDIPPATPYGAAKHSLFLTALRLAEQADAKVAWARLFHLYGPNEDRHRLVPAAIGSLLAAKEFLATSGVQVRDYLHSADAARALCDLLEREVSGAVNVCSGAAVAVSELLGEIGRRIGRPELIRLGALAVRPPWDPPYLVGDNSRLCALTAWRPQYDLGTGLEQVIEWWRANN